MTRMGDGSRIEMTADDVRRDLEAGSQDAAGRANVPALIDDEINYLMDLFQSKDRVVGVEMGKEVCLSYDNMTSKIKRAHVPISKIQQLLLFERGLGADTLELTHIDYSFKQCKHVVQYEKPNMEQAVLQTIAPIFYGAMPNLGLYSVPDGPVVNPGDLLPEGKITEAQQAYEEMAEYAIKDMVYVGSELYEKAGADGINFDTTAASGDAEFYATLKAVEILHKKYPDMGIERVVGGGRRPAGNACCTCSCLGNGRITNCRRSGSAYATEPGYANRCSQSVCGGKTGCHGRRSGGHGCHERGSGRSGYRTCQRNTRCRQGDRCQIQNSGTS